MVPIGVLLVIAASAQRASSIELTIEPRAIESPALKYRLLPAESELKPGNAAPILLRLPWEQTQWMATEYPKLDEKFSRPLDAPEWKTGGRVLPENFYNEMKRAAYRRDASWEYPIGETQSPYMILLPDVQGLRAFLGPGLAGQIRYHIANGELEKAREGILVGLANSRHLSQTPFYITQLVSLAMHRIMLERADELVSQPNSPNLYWALTTLPDTLVQMDRAANFERDIFAITFPAVNDLDRPREEEEWSKMANQLVGFLEEMGEIPRQAPRKEGESVVEQFLKRLMAPEKHILAKAIQQARADLPQMLGVTDDRVAAMSDDEAGLRWYAYMRLARDHEVAAVLSLPAREAWPRLVHTQAQLKAMQEKTGAKGFDFFDPVSLYVTAGELPRKIAALRIIEAVRHHLALTEGKFPASLDEIKDLPIPVDPLTDKPFEWKIADGVAVLTAPPLPAEFFAPGSDAAASRALEYRLHVMPR